MAENEANLQKMLNIMYSWCSKWRLAINTEKTQIIHFRKKAVEQSIHSFMFGEMPLSYVSSYKYLGLLFHEFMSFSEGRKALADSAGRALGA